MNKIIILICLSLTLLNAAEDLFSGYESRLYDEVNPSNNTFYKTYYTNKIKKAFRTLQDDENTLLINQTHQENTAQSTHIASPLIHSDSKVRNVYINNDMKNTKVYIHHEEQ